MTKVLTFSRGSAGVLLLLYLLYLYFQFMTHSHLFIEADQEEVSTEEPRPSSNADTTESTSAAHLWTAAIILIVATACIMVCTHLLIDNINDTADAFNMTKRFIAAILMPIASNAPEMTAVISASRTGRTSYAIGVIVGSILQIALLVIPFLVILGWIIRQPMSLNFETFQTTILFFAVLMVSRILRDIEYTYLHGLMLVEL
jgi:Ca2+:H+ antiporter